MVSSLLSQMIDFATFKVGTPVSLGWSGVGTQSYTATKFGIVTVQTAVTAGKYVDISLNGTTIARAQAPGTAYTWIPFSIMVNAGDVVKATSQDGGSSAQIYPGYCKFIPLS